jgi:rhodanese-related sulfurtransferase
MIQTLKNLFGIGPKVNIAEWVAQGATILDVRSKGEYAGGHVKGSLNIPLDQLSGNLKKMKGKDHPVITCCASGMRSGAAKRLLKSQGYTQVHNGGAWTSLKQYGK